MNSFKDFGSQKFPFPLPNSLNLLLNRGQANAVRLILILRAALVALDLAGLILVGISASLLTGTNLSEQSPTSKLVEIINSLGFAEAYSVLACAAIGFFILKAALSIWLNNWMLRRVAKIETEKSSEMFSKIGTSNLESVETFTKHEISKALIEGYEQGISRQTMALSIVISECFLVFVVSAYLALTDLRLFLIFGIFFAVMILSMNQLVGKRARASASKIHRKYLETEATIFEFIENFRQVTSLQAQEYFQKKYFLSRSSIADASATLSGLTVLPRYFTELTLITGFGALIVLRSLYGDSLFSPSVLAIFVAGSFRILSSLLPLQGALTMLKQIRVSSALAQMLEETFTEVNVARKNMQTGQNSLRLKIDRLSYRFPNDENYVIQSFSADIKIGEFVALVGPSGSGKSTLADLILGLREPNLGNITIGGKNLRTHIQEFPGSISYIPQETEIFGGTLLQNVTLQHDASEETRTRVKDLLEELNLNSLVMSLPAGLDTKIGESFRNLSGGQKQRIGLARALLKDPEIIVLDESTSALDEDSEKAILTLLNKFRGEKTIIAIAHRGQVIAQADRVIKMRRGRD